MIGRVGVSHCKFSDWRSHNGRANEHDWQVPRDHRLEADEGRCFVEFHDERRSRATTEGDSGPDRR